LVPPAARFTTITDAPYVRTSDGSTNVRLWARRVRSFHPICAEHQLLNLAELVDGPSPELCDALALAGDDSRSKTEAAPDEPRSSAREELAREKLQHQAIHLGRVLVRGPVAGLGHPVHVE